MVTKEDQYIVMIIEDKKPKGICELTDWWNTRSLERYSFQRITTRLCLKRTDTSCIHYPMTLYAVRVIGTYVTFYKSEISSHYMIECMERLPSNNSIIIKRYTQQAERTENLGRRLNAWNFCCESDRIDIIRTLKSLQLLYK